MADYIRINWVFALGFLAQGFFASRILVQWLATEKSKHVASPTLFWKLSLAGSVLFLVYGTLRLDIVIIIGQLVGYFIYIRNLQLKHEWMKFSHTSKFVLLALPFVTLGWLFIQSKQVNLTDAFLQEMSGFLWVGLVGQWLLNIRFIYQLYYAEQNRESLLPIGFWWISLAGSILIVVYAIYRVDPVLLVAQGISIVPYARNIMLSNASTFKTSGKYNST